MAAFIIDPPNLFAPESEWGAHIERLQLLLKENPSDSGLLAALRDAKNRPKLA